jgi:RNA polymerase-binding transcription factor DksA
MSAQTWKNREPSTWNSEWNQIHSEREEVCEELVRSSVADTSSGNLRVENRSLSRYLEARLRLLDDAMDRLIAGSYGHCESCGHPLDDARLQVDPAIAKCDACENAAYH